jgi:hypothetical protein
MLRKSLILIVLFSIILSFNSALASTGSCVGNCGMSAGDCWCDSGCVIFGDCCDDYVEVCVNPYQDFPVFIFDTDVDSYNDILGTLFNNGRVQVLVDDVIKGINENANSEMRIQIEGIDEGSFPEGAIRIALPNTIYVNYENIKVKGIDSANVMYDFEFTGVGNLTSTKNILNNLLGNSSILDFLIAEDLMVYLSDSNPVSNTLFLEKNSHKIITILWNKSTQNVNNIDIRIPIYQLPNDVLKVLNIQKMAIYAIYKNKNDKIINIEILKDDISPNLP